MWRGWVGVRVEGGYRSVGVWEWMGVCRGFRMNGVYGV